MERVEHRGMPKGLPSAVTRSLCLPHFLVTQHCFHVGTSEMSGDGMPSVKII